ncbi:MAG: TetR/AcrR family transcriptional regulator [Alphaproteobacteria bacterium]|nr:TetR/AcrR family transcriptional regulator [Alphaproteobacteria bacterium]
MNAPVAPKSARVDGRRQRSERTRQAIMDAYIALLRERPQIPTAAQIAVRAGVSTRSIFERFDDLQTLSLATVDYAFAIGESQVVARNVDGDRQTRLRSHVETRARTCEQWLPLWRVVVNNASRLDELDVRIRIVREVVSRRIELMYAPELGSVDADKRRDLLVALEILTDFESWGRMREVNGLSFEEACRVWVDTIDRLLPATPRDGHGS